MEWCYFAGDMAGTIASTVSDDADIMPLVDTFAPNFLHHSGSLNFTNPGEYGFMPDEDEMRFEILPDTQIEPHVLQDPPTYPVSAIVQEASVPMVKR